MSKIWNWFTNDVVQQVATTIACGLAGLLVLLWRGWPLLAFLTSVPFFIAAAGFWYRQRWAKAVSIAMLAGLATFAVHRMIFVEFSWLLVLGTAFMLYGIWDNWNYDLRSKRPGESDDDRPMVSLVLLFREPRYLDGAMLKSLVEKAWGVELEESDDATDSFVVGEEPPFMIMRDGNMHIVHNFAASYFDDAAVLAESITELRQRQAVLDCRAWASVDLLGGEDDPQKLKEAYQRLGRLLVELADDTCLAIYCPATGKLIPYDPALDERLRGDDPLEDLVPHFAPVQLVADDDPRMKAAVAEARRRWPEFVAAFESRTDGQSFAVKAPFSDGQHTEFMWLGVTAIEGDVIYGRLDNDPVNVSNVKSGDRVRNQLVDLNDWMFTQGDDMQGGFTTKVLMEIYKNQ